MGFANWQIKEARVRTAEDIDCGFGSANWDSRFQGRQRA